jgi:hypothetical protein
MIQQVSDRGVRSETETKSNITNRVEEVHSASESEIRQDGGLTAWLQVFACWLLFMNTWSVLKSEARIILSLLMF